MREVVFYRWIFGVALLLAGLLSWSTKSPDGGFLGLALALVVFYPFALLFVWLAGMFAMWAFYFALDAWDFLLRLLGLREWD